MFTDSKLQLSQLFQLRQELGIPIEALEIAGFSEAAAEIGGDYYDVVQHQGRIIIGIGDVSGHGLDRLCAVVQQNWQKSAQGIRQAVIENLRSHIGTEQVYDDITLVVLKRK